MGVGEGLVVGQDLRRQFAQVIGDALAATNRVGMGDSRRMELAEAYWSAAGQLWPRLERQVLQASHPLTGGPLEAAKAALTLAQELSTAFKHLLASEAGKRISLGGARLASALVHRCLQCFARVLAASYQSYSPVPANTWIDAHAVYAYARDRGVHLATIPGDVSEATPERIYVQALLLGRHPLRPAALAVLNTSLLSLIERALDQGEGT